MFWSLAPLVVGCILLAGLVGMCSFQLGGTKRGPIPSYDAAQALRADAKTLGFPIRLPQLPGGWTPNSGGRGGIENGRADPATGQRRNAATSIVGFISPTGRYLSLTQSNADEDKLVGSIHPSMYPTGTVDVGGTRWVVYEGSEKTVPSSRYGRHGSPDRAGPPSWQSPVPAASISSARWRRRRNRSPRCPHDSGSHSAVDGGGAFLDVAGPRRGSHLRRTGGASNCSSSTPLYTAR
ncbi:Uncharacterised protein [Mycobacterium tuberculosis]|nr:Uncharacterised protein [Mycobacterium tuberculosis]